MIIDLYLDVIIVLRYFQFFFSNNFLKKMTEIVEQHVLDRYKLLKKVGSGAYGHVWKVQQIKTGEILALKKIFDAFQHSTDAQRTYRQIILLHQISNENIVKLHKVIKSENDKDLYLVFQFMQADLHNAIGQKILKDLHNRYIVYQLLKGIQYLHHANIIHRDLKPSNLLINSDCSLKICDLGLARTIQAKYHQQEQIFTEQVATRWYRAPEVLLGSQTYGTAADVWSIGCILAEMLTGKPFFPGNSTLNQLQKIVSFTGKPSKNDIESIQSPLATSMLQSLGKITKRKLSQWFKGEVNQEGIDLVLRTLQFNPNKRLTVQQILNHPYVRQFNRSHRTQNVKKVYLSISENKKKSVKQYKRLIYEWICDTYKDESDSSFFKNSLLKQNGRLPLKESVNQNVKKSLSAKHSSSSSFIKETPSCSSKKISQTPKMLGSSSYSTKKLLRCNSQKSSKFATNKEEFLQSPLSSTYKQFKTLKEMYLGSKNIPIKKSPSIFASLKQKPEKGSSMSHLLSKFSKPISTQPNFGIIKSGKSYL